MVLLGTTGFILATGWPFGLESVWRVLLQSTFFAFNIFAPSDSGYFAGNAMLKPFLHTWSLGVEMQFYVVWPFVCLALRKLSVRGQIAGLGLVVLLSFVASVIVAFNDGPVAYYSIPTRLWEFAIGGLLVVVPLDKLSHLPARVVGAAQIIATAIVGSMVFFASGDMWPTGWAALLCLALAIIMATANLPSAFVSRMLTWSPLRLMGRLSYSAYLVHWPIAVFAYTILSSYDTNPMLRLGLLVLSFALAAVVYVVIERPMRAIGKREASVRDWAFPATVLPLLLGCIFVFSSSERLKMIVPEATLGIADQESEYRSFVKYCDNTGCRLGEKNTEQIKVAIWGDSHARHFAFGFVVPWSSETSDSV